jgi:hypothetical protein
LIAHLALCGEHELDYDGDGNMCDPDFDNNGNGAVNINDLNRLKSYLGTPPGPSALYPNCPPTCP